jgi:hypothetical protein
VKPVGVVEDERDPDDRDEQPLHQLFSSTTPSITLATSSQRSIAPSTSS